MSQLVGFLHEHHSAFHVVIYDGNKHYMHNQGFTSLDSAAQMRDCILKARGINDPTRWIAQVGKQNPKSVPNTSRISNF